MTEQESTLPNTLKYNFQSSFTFRGFAMRHFFTLSVIALAALLGACGDNSTTPTTTTGEIYGHAFLVNEYGVTLADNSGITAQLLEDGKVIQNITTSNDGMYYFKNVQAGVYDVLVFKQGYAVFRNSSDTISRKNEQFVGRGKFRIVGDWEFISTAAIDTNYWALKPDIRYEVIKDVKVVNDIWITDSVKNDGHPDTLNTRWGSGTKETRKIRFTIDYEKTLPFATMKRTVKVLINGTSFTITSDANALSGVYEYTSPNVIIRDSVSRIVYDRGRGGSFSFVQAKNITVQASTIIPNEIRKSDQPNKVTRTNELKLSLTD